MFEDKPNWMLLKECGERLTKEGKVPFSRKQVIDCVQRNYPTKERSLLNAMIQGMTINLKGGDPVGVGKNLFYNIHGRLEVYDPKRHGHPSLFALYKATKASVEDCVRDWITRLNALFDNLTEWVSDDGDDGLKPERTQRKQLTEELMRRYNVVPRNIPVLRISKGNRGITFMPSAIWIIGAHGRIDVLAEKNQYILLDMRERKTDQSEWTLVVEDIGECAVPFDKKVFSELLRENI